MGNLGRALAAYRGFAERGFRVIALLDGDPRVVGERVAGPAGAADGATSPGLVADDGLAIGVIATPSEGAQQACDDLVAAGVRSVLNFAPGRARGARRRRRAQGRPVDRAADPRLPRPEGRRAGRGRRHEPRRPRAVAPRRPAVPPRVGRPRPRGAHRARGRRAALRARQRGRRGLDVQPHRGVCRVPHLPRCARRHRPPPWRRCARSTAPSSSRTCSSTTRTAASRTSSRSPPGSTRWPSARRRSSGQVRRSLARAQRHGHVGPALNGVLQQALRVAQAGAHRDRHRPRERLARAGRAHPRRGRARRPGRPVGARRRRRRHGRPRRDDRRARRRPHRRRRQPQPRPRPHGRRAGRGHRPTAGRPARRPRRRRRRHLLHRGARPGRARRRRPRGARPSGRPPPGLRRPRPAARRRPRGRRTCPAPPASGSASSARTSPTPAPPPRSPRRPTSSPARWPRTC